MTTEATPLTADTIETHPGAGQGLMTRLCSNYRAIVFGAGGSLGQAWTRLLASDPRCCEVIGLSRGSDPAIVLEDEDTLRRAAQALKDKGPFHLILDATGALIIDDRGPEKRLEELNPQALLRAMQVNAVGPALLMKHFVPLLVSGERSIWAKLSARVGSIEDNRKGGWYGYRASKSALNMLLQTAAIEVARRRPLAVVAALQPGTVRSPLSQPFVGDDAMDPAISARQMLIALDRLDPSGRAQFLDYRGSGIPW
jgi:NAD(P)-dependent dehydrogenase (short-subunit alcohol dehydrogenase family)